MNIQTLVLPMDRVTLMCADKDQMATSLSWNPAGLAQWLFVHIFCEFTILMSIQNSPGK